MPSKPRETKVLGQDIPGFCRDIPGAPEKFEKKRFVFNFRPLERSGNPPEHPFLRLFFVFASQNKITLQCQNNLENVHSMLDIFENPYGAPGPRSPKTPQATKKESPQTQKSSRKAYFPQKVSVISPKVNALSPKGHAKYFREFLKNLKFFEIFCWGGGGTVTGVSKYLLTFASQNHITLQGQNNLENVHSMLVLKEDRLPPFGGLFFAPTSEIKNSENQRI